MRHKVIKVKVGTYKESGEPIYIRTIISGKWVREKKTLIHYHGYGGSAALNFKIFQDLSEDFNQIAFDIIGMGGSSRPDDFSLDFTAEQCLNYFIDYFERWRVALPKHFKPLRETELTGFYIAGHSFGGYLSTHYTIRYPQHVK